MRIVLLVLALAAATYAHKTCTPQAFFRTECNNCKCTPDGTATYCTQRICPPGFFNADGSMKVPLDIIQQIIPDISEIEIIPAQKINDVQTLFVKVCTPKSFFHIDCNKCRCSPLGDRYTCTKKVCPKQPIHVPHHHGHHRAALSAEEKKCEPGTTYYDYCNTCHCSKDGQPGECTKMACDERVFNKDGTLKKPYSDLIKPFF